MTNKIALHVALKESSTAVGSVKVAADTPLVDKFAELRKLAVAASEKWGINQDEFYGIETDGNGWVLHKYSLD